MSHVMRRILLCAEMTDRLSRTTLIRMVAGAAAQIRQHHLRLSQLDSVAGDGDHGTAMLRCVEKMERAVAAAPNHCLRTCFEQIAWAIFDSDGGASSSLLGAFFLGMRDGVPPKCASLDCHELAAAFESGLHAIRKQTLAQVGDKTMMDALVPAVESLSAAAHEGNAIDDSLERAARSAIVGAEATKNLIAQHGRSRLLGEKTRGYPDPGATSVAWLFQGFFEGLRDTKGESGNA
jgi:phosphoenolpyruvate---glycerone phosphotransferase subunit DhaL